VNDLEYTGLRHEGAREAVDALNRWLRHDPGCDAIGDGPQSLDCGCGLREVVDRIDKAWP
jgi:hypothetical protein